LQADSCLKFEGENGLIYIGEEKDDVLEVSLSIKFGENLTEDERYFYIEINCEDEKDIDKFAELSEKIKFNLQKIDSESVRINTLWDDIGRYYATKAYPLINEIENLMRKLISQFMLINVGMEWTNTAMHDELKEKIQKKNKSIEPLIDDLHKTDFIHLSDVLFKKYRTLDIEELNRKLSGAEKNSQIDFNEIKGFILKSNWERHFSSKVDFKEESLKKQWEMLYELRNKVAHNRFVTKNDYNKIRGLVESLKPVINSSLNKLEEIQLKEEEKESVISSYSSPPASAGFIIAAEAYLAEQCVAEWYKKQYDDVKRAHEILDIGYQYLVTPKDGKHIAVIVKHMKSFYPQEIKKRLKNLKFPWEGSETFEKHIVFVIEDLKLKFITDSMNLEFNDYVNANIKVILGYINSENNFIPVS